MAIFQVDNKQTFIFSQLKKRKQELIQASKLQASKQALSFLL
jgi:hypothetical protein